MDNPNTLATILNNHRNEKHLIVLHDSPDPDAISSAYAHSQISAAYGIETTLLYNGSTSRQQSMVLLKLLGIDLVRYDNQMDLSGYQGSVFVDGQGITSEKIVTALENVGVPVIAVLDHHEPEDRLKPEFKDIQRVGATATLYARYLEQGVMQLDRSKKEHISMATALLFGILTDTVNFIIAQPPDFEAAAFLSRYRDPEFLEKIMSRTRSKYVMDIIRRTLGEREQVENYSIAGIGYLRADDRESISQAAEFLLTEENVHTSIVYGIIKASDQEERLVGAMCTSKITIDTQEFLQDIFGSNLSSIVPLDENVSVANFSIPIGFLAGDVSDEQQDLKWQVFDAQVKHKIFRRIGVAREVLEGLS